MKLTTSKKIILTCLLAAAAVTGGIFYYRTAIMAQGPIYEFDEKRDTQDILDLFKKDYYWLVEGEYNAAAMLKYRAPSASPSKKGQMHIKVLRHDNQFVGFVAYYKKIGSEWKLNFIAVRDEFRGKGYAQKLMQYALDDMKRMGAKHITLVTRTSNTSAQKLYNRMEFTETYRDVRPATAQESDDWKGYVYFEYRVK